MNSWPSWTIGGCVDLKWFLWDWYVEAAGNCAIDTKDFLKELNIIDLKNIKYFISLNIKLVYKKDGSQYRETYPALGHFSFSNFFKLLLAEIWKK